MRVVTIEHNLSGYHKKDTSTYVKLNGVIISVTITNNMFVVIKCIMFELSL